MPEHPIEQAFRTDLAHFASLGNWHDWQQVRAIYADWLEEHRADDAPLVRASWFLWRGTHTSHVQTWCVRPLSPIPRPAGGSRLAKLFLGTVNSAPVLHFAPSTLLLRDPVSYTAQPRDWLHSLYFTYKADRKSWGWFDLGAHRQGFRALFVENPGDY